MSAICPQCQGYAKTIPINEQCNAPNSVTFTAPTQVPLSLCNFCNGLGYFLGGMI